MRLSVTRGEGRRHHITSVRDDGEVGFYAMADYGPALPHDLAHVVVESLFELPFGFWGLVAAGARFDTLNRAASRTPAVRRTDPVVESHLAELLVAEGLVNLFHQQQIARHEDDYAYLEEAGSVCAEHGQPLPATISAGLVGRTRRGIADMNERWQATPPGETMHLAFPMREEGW